MKIRNIKLKEYGPIRDFSLEPSDFEIVYGRNESGKTALVEALINVLFKKTAKVIRYGKPRDIQVELDDAGRTINPADKKSAPDLPAGDIGNLHYIQSSETELYQKDGTGFWEGIKLTLSQTGAGMTYAKIIKKVYEKVGLQAKEKNWAVAKKPVVQGVVERKDKLEKYFTQIDEITATKKRAQALSEECARLEKELQAIRSAKQFISYQAIRDLLERYRGNKNVLADYQRYDDRYLEEWRQLEAEKKSRGNIDANLQRSKADLERLEKDLSGLKHQDDFIRHGDFERLLALPVQTRTEPNLFLPILLFLIGVAALILSYKFRFSPFFPVALFGACVAAFIFVQYRRGVIRKDFYETELLLEKGRLMFPDLKNREDLRKKIESVRVNLAVVESAYREKQEMLQQLSGTQPRDEIDRKINDLRNKTGLAEFTDLRDKIAEKNRLRAEGAGLKAKLESNLEERDESRWPDLIEKRKTVKPSAPVPRADPEREEEVNAIREKKNRELDGLRHTIGVFEASREQIFGVDDYRAALIEYNRLTEQAAEFELEKMAALKAEEVLNGMSEELDDFIRDIARGDRGLSDNFQRVTGRYKEVVIRDRDFIAIDHDGREFPIEQLSSGTRDQLLLCFRMAALEKLFPAGSFMILDDAFIFSDWPRRQKMVELLKSFAGMGNQVIYLTSDDHTRGIFAASGAHVTTIE